MSIFKKGKEKENEFAIIGLGRFGGSLARRLGAMPWWARAAVSAALLFAVAGVGFSKMAFIYFQF